MNSRSAFVSVLVLTSFSTAFAGETEALKAPEVEIIRGPRRNEQRQVQRTPEATKPTAQELDAKAQELAEREAALEAQAKAVDAREAEVKRTEESRTERSKREDRERAQRQKAIEELARKTQQEFQNAAKALAGE